MSKKIEYVDIRTATAEQMEYAFGRERELLVQLLTQIKTDLESFNENWNKSGKPVVFIFDFTEDVQERYMLNWQNSLKKNGNSA